jgi:hypothetical protein
MADVGKGWVASVFIFQYSETLCRTSFLLIREGNIIQFPLVAASILMDVSEMIRWPYSCSYYLSWKSSDKTNRYSWSVREREQKGSAKFIKLQWRNDLATKTLNKWSFKTMEADLDFKVPMSATGTRLASSWRLMNDIYIIIEKRGLIQERFLTISHVLNKLRIM